MVSWPVLTAAPEEAVLVPVAAMAFWAALRCELLTPLAELALLELLRGDGAVTVPDGNWVFAVPVAAPPAVLTHI
jgi:hypothetical protein